MIRKMAEDLYFFIVILTVFLFTFGIFLQSNLNYENNNNLNWYQLINKFVK
jgi:hypothetical protein